MRQKGNQAERKQTPKFRRHVDSDVSVLLAAFPALEAAATAVGPPQAPFAAEVPSRAGVGANYLLRALAPFPFAQCMRPTGCDLVEFGLEDQDARAGVQREAQTEVWSPSRTTDRRIERHPVRERRALSNDSLTSFIARSKSSSSTNKSIILLYFVPVLGSVGFSPNRCNLSIICNNYPHSSIK